ncbi:MAG: hypothetical protein PWP70_1123 [Moorella sp. (in: firmicutes)]|nr:hypothetical protein [Moorella sp. (in: firmicutes)]
MSAKQIGFIFDQVRCIGCQACETNCKAVWNLPTGIRYRRVISTALTGTTAAQRVHLSMACNHCANPACMKVCPVGAITKREKDGIVILDSDRCIGCQYCLQACPYHAPQFNKATGRVQKCHFCQPLLDNNGLPACVQGCPTKALTFGEITNFDAQFPQMAAAIPSPLATNPSLRIKMTSNKHVVPDGEATLNGTGIQGDMASYFKEVSGVHWWMNVARPGGKAVMGAAAVAVGASLVVGATKQGGKDHEHREN